MRNLYNYTNNSSYTLKTLSTNIIMIHISTREVFKMEDPFSTYDRQDVAAAFKVHEVYSIAKMYIIHWDNENNCWTVNEIEQL